MMTPSRQPGSGWSRLVEPDMIVALSAVLIGLCALGVSLVQVRIMRAEQHAAVWPRLAIANTYSGGRLGIVVMNPGIGPAVIRSVTAAVDGRPTKDWPAVLDALAGEDRSWNLVRSTIHDRIVPARATITTVELVDSPLVDRILDELHRLTFEICYCSVYDRCWLAAWRDASAPREVAACPVEPALAFED